MNAPVPATPDPLVKLNYDETVTVLGQALGNLTTLRTNSTTILAFGTGAAGFFGLSTASKQWPYALSLLFYGLATLTAMSIYIPLHLKLNVVMGLGEALKKQPIPIDEAYDQIINDRQTAIAKVGEHLNDGFLWGLGGRFIVLMLLVSLSIISAGSNLLIKDSSSPPPTHIVIDQGVPTVSPPTK